MGDTRQNAHEIIDRLPESQVSAVLTLLERLAAPTTSQRARRLDQGVGLSGKLSRLYKLRVKS
jgi:hypothetical protein